MEKFYVLHRDFMSAKPKEQFALKIIKAEDSEVAYLEIEENIATNNSQEWLLTQAEFKELKKVLEKGV